MASPSAAPNPRDRYVKGDRIGHGAYKTVYQAIDRDRGIEVAWNEIQLDGDVDVAKLSGEIQLLSELHSEYIMEFYESWVDHEDMKLIFITELMTSGSLRNFVQKAKSVAVAVIREWSRQILLGLEYLHSRTPSIVHRDIKLDNIFFHGTQGKVKIGDLGLATIVSRTSARLSVIGTPEFMAPEFYYERYNEKVDIWAFGLALIEMVTLEYPYSECTNIASVYRAVSSGMKPAALAKIKDARMFEFIACCLEFDMIARYSATELLRHPWFDIVDDGVKYVQLATDEEHKAILAEVGGTPLGWSNYVAKVCDPIRGDPSYRLHFAGTVQGTTASAPVTPLRDDLSAEAVIDSRQRSMSVEDVGNEAAQVGRDSGTHVQVHAYPGAHTDDTPRGEHADLRIESPAAHTALEHVNEAAMIATTHHHTHSSPVPILPVRRESESEDVIILTPMKSMRPSSSPNEGDVVLRTPRGGPRLRPRLHSRPRARSPFSDDVVLTPSDLDSSNEFSAADSDDEVLASEPTISDNELMEDIEEGDEDVELSDDLEEQFGTVETARRIAIGATSPSDDMVLVSPSAKNVQRLTNTLSARELRRLRTRSTSNDDEVIPDAMLEDSEQRHSNVETVPRRRVTLAAPTSFHSSPTSLSGGRHSPPKLRIAEATLSDDDDDELLTTSMPSSPMKRKMSVVIEEKSAEPLPSSAVPAHVNLAPRVLELKLNLYIPDIQFKKAFMFKYNEAQDTPERVAHEFVKHLNIPDVYHAQIVSHIRDQIAAGQQARHSPAHVQTSSPSTTVASSPSSVSDVSPRLSLANLQAQIALQPQSAHSANFPPTYGSEDAATSRLAKRPPSHILTSAPVKGSRGEGAKHTRMMSLQYRNHRQRDSYDEIDYVVDVVPQERHERISLDLAREPKRLIPLSQSSPPQRKFSNPSPSPRRAEAELKAAHEQELRQLEEQRRALAQKHAKELEMLEKRKLERSMGSPSTSPSTRRRFDSREESTLPPRHRIHAEYDDEDDEVISGSHASSPGAHLSLTRPVDIKHRRSVPTMLHSTFSQSAPNYSLNRMRSSPMSSVPHTSPLSPLKEEPLGMPVMPTYEPSPLMRRTSLDMHRRPVALRDNMSDQALTLQQPPEQRKMSQSGGPRDKRDWTYSGSESD